MSGRRSEKGKERKRRRRKEEGKEEEDRQTLGDMILSPQCGKPVELLDFPGT